MNLPAWAEETAGRHLAEPLPRRWAHTQGVAARSRFLAPILGNDADLLEAAAWLHDIGYAPEIAITAFHPLDGALYLRDVAGVDVLVCQLVAYHSCAVIEAEERGLREALEGEFDQPPRDLLDAVTFCDMTTDPRGAPIAVEDRLAEIAARYDEGDVVARSIKRAERSILRTTERIASRLSRSKSP